MTVPDLLTSQTLQEINVINADGIVGSEPRNYRSITGIAFNTIQGLPAGIMGTLHAEEASVA